jgi:hypothetical protein
MSQYTALTVEEKKAIAELKKLAPKWPKSLWLYSASGSLHVMKLNENGEHAMTIDGGADSEYIVESIRGIDNDGGDW